MKISRLETERLALRPFRMDDAEALTAILQDPGIARPERHRGEIGYWIGSAFRGKGHATEAASRVISWGFETAGLYRIQATYLTGSEGSAAVRQKIGMLPEVTLRGFGDRDGKRSDIHIAAVLRDDPTWLPSQDQGLRSG